MSMRVKGVLNQVSEIFEVSAFLYKYKSQMVLLPLCAIAAAYNPNIKYHRQMYNDFIRLSKPARKRLFHQERLKMCAMEPDRFFSGCLICLEEACENGAKRVFRREMPVLQCLTFDNGIYLEAAVLRHGDKKIYRMEPEDCCESLRKVTEEVETLQTTRKIPTIPELDDEDGKKAESVCELAYIMANIYDYKGLKQQRARLYGLPLGDNTEEVETLEDLFLLTLFEIWSALWNRKP